MQQVEIRKAENGYIVMQTENRFGIGRGGDYVFNTLPEVLDCLLAYFEGRSQYFGGESFGKVVVLAKPTEEYPVLK